MITRYLLKSLLPPFKYGDIVIIHYDPNTVSYIVTDVKNPNIKAVIDSNQLENLDFVEYL